MPTPSVTNQIPIREGSEAAGGYLLPPEQGEILVNGILVETGALQIAGDARSTSARKTNFPIWEGRPVAGPVGEGAEKGVTGASFNQAVLNVKKFASIVLFTDEQLQDLQNGDLNVLVDAGVRQALSVAIDAHALGSSGGTYIEKGATQESTVNGASEAKEGAKYGSVFDSPLLGQASQGIVLPGVTETNIQKGVSAGLALLEENGYGNPNDIGVLVGFGFQRYLRDARDGFGRPLYDGGSFGGQSVDAFYGLDRAHSTNLAAITSAAQTIKLASTSGSASYVVSGRSGETNPVPLYIGQPVEANAALGIVGTEIVIKAITGKIGEETAVELGKFNTSTGVIEAVTSTKTEATATAATVKRPVGVIVHKPNIHVRMREDVVVRTSNEATIKNGGTTYNLFQQNLFAVLYECRLGYMIHDGARAVVPLWY